MPVVFLCSEVPVRLLVSPSIGVDGGLLVDVGVELLHVTVVGAALFEGGVFVANLEVVLHQVRIDWLNFSEAMLNEVVLVIAFVVR